VTRDPNMFLPWGISTCTLKNDPSPKVHPVDHQSHQRKKQLAA
jgi:hypothetical protein